MAKLKYNIENTDNGIVVSVDGNVVENQSREYSRPILYSLDWFSKITY